jgi:hypothetical protein
VAANCALEQFDLGVEFDFRSLNLLLVAAITASVLASAGRTGRLARASASTKPLALRHAFVKYFFTPPGLLNQLRSSFGTTTDAIGASPSVVSATSAPQ